MFCVFFCDMRVLCVPVCPRLGSCADRGHARGTFTHVSGCSRGEADVLSSNRGVHTDLGERRSRTFGRRRRRSSQHLALSSVCSLWSTLWRIEIRCSVAELFEGVSTSKQGD